MKLKQIKLRIALKGYLEKPYVLLLTLCGNKRFLQVVVHHIPLPLESVCPLVRTMFLNAWPKCWRLEEAQSFTSGLLSFQNSRCFKCHFFKALPGPWWEVEAGIWKMVCKENILFTEFKKGVMQVLGIKVCSNMCELLCWVVALEHSSLYVVFVESDRNGGGGCCSCSWGCGGWGSISRIRIWACQPFQLSLILLCWTILWKNLLIDRCAHIDLVVKNRYQCHCQWQT